MWWAWILLWRLCLPVAAIASECGGEGEQVRSALEEIGRQVQAVRVQLTDLRLTGHTLTTVWSLAALALLAWVAVLWWRLRRALEEIATLRRTRMLRSNAGSR
jgi:hypothetical protein